MADNGGGFLRDLPAEGGPPRRAPPRLSAAGAGRLCRRSRDLWAGDPVFLDLLQRLREGCAEFGAWWEAHDIRGVAAGRKVLSHPKKGRLRLEYSSFQSNDDAALKLVIYTTA
jgi:hypothetical protein